jgi:2-polyprenyl-6-methoxyphenol hydroxylase-like FAD-dependent oxidoreductase
MSKPLTGNVAIVGGSLTGLATGIGIARNGIPVSIFEQAAGEERGGTGLGVDRGLITQTTGCDARGSGSGSGVPVVDEGHRETSTWLSIYRWLRTNADVTPLLRIHESTRVDIVSYDDDAAYIKGPSVDATADVVLGADGYRSVVRRVVCPNHPFAAYGGFIIWRALVLESWLPERFLEHTWLGGGRLPFPEAARLVMYRVPGPNGETTPGRRAITLAWYDATRTPWLRDNGYIVGGEVMGSVLPSAVDDDVRNDLLAVSAKRWRGMAREIIRQAIERRIVFGTPLTEYLPERLTCGRVGILGDAAHVASPMVGAGFASGLRDGAAFIDALVGSGGAARDAGERTLEVYNDARLLPNRRRVLESIAETKALLRSVSAM